MRVPSLEKKRERAAVVIQKHWRRRLAREMCVLEAARKQRNLVKRAGFLSPFAIVSGLRIKDRKVLISEDLNSRKSIEKDIQSSQFPSLKDLFIDAEAEKTAVALVLQKIHRGTVAREQVQLAKQYSAHVPVATKLVTLGARTYAASVYSTEGTVSVEAAPLKPEFRGELLKATFGRSETKRFGKPVDFEGLLQALRVEKGGLRLAAAPAEALYRTEVRLEGRKYTLVASTDKPGLESSMVFEAQCEEMRLETRKSVRELIACTGEMSNTREIARLSCTYLLSLRANKLELNTSIRIPALVTRLQAVLRGYLLRRELPYTLPQHSVPRPRSQFSHTHTFSVSVSSSAHSSPKADRTQTLNLENHEKRGRLRLETMAPTFIASLSPSPSEASPIHSKTLKRFDSLNASDTEEPPFQFRIPTPKKERKVRRSTNKRTKSDIPSAITQRRLKSGDVMFVPVYESAQSELVTKVGAEISGYHCVVAVYRTDQGATIETVLSGSKEMFHLNLPDLLPSEQQEAEIAASALIARLRLRNRKGVLALELRPAAAQVLYKRSHYISERYMVVTVLDQGSSVELQAADPAGQRVLQLSLGRIKAISAEQLYRQICALVVRLRVEKVLGDEVLVLGS
jgi:hypothetical protein